MVVGFQVEKKLYYDSSNLKTIQRQISWNNFIEEIKSVQALFISVIQVRTDQGLVVKIRCPIRSW